jgi:hypothetical protein
MTLESLGMTTRLIRSARMNKNNGRSPDSPKNSRDGNAITISDAECFIIMPLSDVDGYDAGHFKQVYEDLFTPACDSAGYKAVRADDVRQTNLIHLDVLQKIIDSPMALCDLSSRNPNVLFELGLRQAFDKPVVLVQEVGTPPIFDIHPLRYTHYHKEMSYRQVVEDQISIRDAIIATKEDIGNEKSINSIVRLLSLTQPATLNKISEGDKDSALLQVLMSEMANLRSEFRASRATKEGTVSTATTLALPREVTLTMDYIENVGLEDYFVLGYNLAPALVRTGLRKSKNSRDLFRFFQESRHVPDSFKQEYFGLGRVSFDFLDEALAKAKKLLSATKGTPSV